ncbi:DeoR/GlpR transcriptional regulator [Sesbania bispinosa]|nr:DeoR/GlpR transcriptional regulator [Sesbania bispinosa]
MTEKGMKRWWVWNERGVVGTSGVSTSMICGCTYEYDESLQCHQVAGKVTSQKSNKSVGPMSMSCSDWFFIP